MLIFCYFIYQLLLNTATEVILRTKTNYQINVVQFAMYSVDWTAKSIKFKKMLLLAMSLNTTNKLKMDITPQKTINLEVFASINKVELAMYSIDWTDKNIKFKKMLLLTMSLNNTKRLKMNITPQKTLNLEVFASAMRVSYSIVSLLTKKTNFK
ncbi:uncharacterized protein LOC126907347 isoform X5 [Daktulosphaira vitifoliae]|uniref:uncharacterized protein LOC126907347 isoform X5 n=1 Tax=Daktulosphaira vitifoliae TaxID=58002 RepID=UPI0021A99E3D|nr:uncharacterized protein LOC126907347 isoform X5 [Daktulosphaira vitifoliae]